jgi:hypothetical protein
MSASFRHRILDATYAQFGVDAVLTRPGGAAREVRVLLGRDSGEKEAVMPFGAMSRPVLDAVLVRLRAHDPGLADLGEPRHDDVIVIDAGADVRAGEALVIDGDPRRLDAFRLEWTCSCAEPDAELEPEGEPDPDPEAP